jgi:DNA-binding protein WhiA
LAGGSLSDPEKAYHLEVVCAERKKSEELAETINAFGLKARTIERKGHFVVYLKEGENIVDLLNIMGAHLSLLNMENLRIVKDMRNNVNRQVNCETSNLSKTVRASIRQIDDINTIARMKGLGFLSDQLKEAAETRLLYEEASLKEIGAMLSPPVGKSGVNHRLRKISEIAENLRGGGNCCSF